MTYCPEFFLGFEAHGQGKRYSRTRSRPWRRGWKAAELRECCRQKYGDR